MDIQKILSWQRAIAWMQKMRISCVSFSTDLHSAIFMSLNLEIPWQCIDASTGVPRTHTLLPGKYEVERIPNPFGYTTQPWIVLKGTKIGGSESFWRYMAKRSWGAFRISLDHDYQAFPSR